MPRSKRVSEYPQEMLLNLQKAGERGETVRIPCQSGKKAVNLRARYYQFRTDLQEERHPITPYLPDLHFKVDGSVLIIDKNRPEGLKS